MPKRYPTALVVLHWLVAFLVIGALLGGRFNMASVPNADPAKLMTLRMHMIVGISILVLMLVRLLLRSRRVMPAPVPGPHWQVRAARAGHLALYLVTIAVAGSGMALGMASGLGPAVFAGAPLPERFDIFAARQVHGALTLVLSALVLGHVGMALWHGLVKRDGIFARMVPARR